MIRRPLKLPSDFNLIFICLLFALLGLGREKMFRDPGVFWHTTVGQEMLDAHALPRADHFTFTHDGQPWIAQQWLAELVMASVNALAGLDGLLLVAAVLLAATYAFLGDRLRRAGLSWPTTLLLLTLVIAAGSYHFLVRPHLVTIALMTCVFSILCDVEAGRAPLRRLLALPLLMILWTNLHGGALGGLATIIIVILLWLCRSHQFGSIESSIRTRCVNLALPAALCTIAILMNPYGPSLPSVWLSLMRSDVLPQTIQEHAPLQIFSFEGVMILALAAVYMVTLFKAWPHGRRSTWLIPLFWLALAFSRVRHGPIFAVTTAIALADMLSTMPRTARLSPQRLILPQPWLVPALCTIAGLILQSTGLRVPFIGAGWATLDSSYWPVETTRALEKFTSNDASPHVFNDMRFGGYLIRYAPGAKVFIDDRCELHGDQGIRRYLEIRQHAPLIEGLANETQLDLALVMTGTSLDRYLAASNRWTRVARDPASCLYSRRRANTPM
jgi:hypothetical protein